MTKCEAYDSCSNAMKTLIGTVVENACEFVNEMIADTDDETMLGTSINTVYEQALVFMATELDPTDVNPVISEFLKKAIREFVIARVGFSRFLINKNEG